MGQEIMSKGYWGLGMQYGDQWRRWRKVCDAVVSSASETYAERQFCAMCMNAAYTKRNYRPFQTHESALLVRDIMDDPQTYKKHFERFATSLTFSVAYGNRIATLNDPLLKENRVAGSAFAATMYVVSSHVTRPSPEND